MKWTINNHRYWNETGLILILSFLLVSQACQSSYDRKQLKKQCDALLDSIAIGDPYPMLPEKNFPRGNVDKMINDLKHACDLENRSGRFINDFYWKRVGKPDLLAFIYEFNLKCGQHRFLISYDMENTPELFEIVVEPTYKENKMILKPERQLPAPK